MPSITLVDRKDLIHPQWAKVIREGYVRRVPKAMKPEDLLIPIMNEEEDTVLDVNNLGTVISNLKTTSGWRLVERAICAKRGVIVSNTELDVNVSNLVLNNTTEALTGIESLRYMRNMGPGVGNWNPSKSILIIGEKPGNGLPMTKRDYAFLCSRGSSGWLCKQLDESGVKESDLYWCNAQDRNGNYTDLSFISELDPPYIITLGKIAFNACSNRNIKVLDVPHPQYWKRFKSKEEYPLVSILKSLCDKNKTPE